ncbi:flavin monoamine oxidase family protein [Sphingomonas sp. Leaf25]|uniref:flavin monoamine oxidase family protein n=1 Tax=Sphingomonas sp. Leaf25 TaxID=1735692 RepID=UPI0007000C82|nr:FAD-dependent oxidoreductase [Sphingomonas sp. Leaf25]KQM98185.1 amine oxidase [Sphingomonas sp. Leaf25]
MIDVAIIGAGAAGIGAARACHAAGRSVAVFEAGDRVGGRAHSVTIDGMALDLGCGYLHSAKRNPWVAIAGDAGFAIDRSRPSWGQQYRDLGFSPVERQAANAARAAFEARLRHDPPASDRAADALDPAGPWNGFLDAMSGYVNGADLASLSVADYLAYDDAATDDDWRLPDGYGRLVAASLPPVPLYLGTPVRGIEERADGVAIVTPRGSVKAGAAIITVSTAVLSGGGIALPGCFDPSLHAASHLPLGLADKLFFALLDDHGLAAEGHLLGNPHRAATGSYYLCPFGRPVVECFVGGSSARALEREGLDGAAAFAKAELAALLGARLVDRMVLIAGSAWGRASHFGGSYSHARPGQANARAVLGERRHDHILIAGEAVSPTDFSTAHGAYATGVAAAEVLLRD